MLLRRVRDADPTLRFGGAGASLYFGPGDGHLFTLALLEHCFNGTNYITGAKGTRIDFVSFHIKETAQILVTQTLESIQRFVDAYPQVADLLFVNNECDRNWGWQNNVVENRDGWYSAYIARQVIEHQLRITNARGWRIMIANDNAFIGGWNNRTHLTLFTSGDRFAFLKKPQHNIFTALSLLGDQQVPVTGFDITREGVTALASRRGEDQVAVLLCNYANSYTGATAKQVEVNLTNLPFTRGKLLHYRIDDAHASPYAAWAALGSPAVPTDASSRRCGMSRK
jgi:hypothetical protein